VGSPFADGGAGAVFLFDGETGQVVREFEGPGGGGDLFGSSVAAIGSDVLIGAPLADVEALNGDGLADAGRAYLYDAATGELRHAFTKPGAAPGDQFGFALAAMGIDIVIAAPLEEPSGSGLVDTGGAYVFDGMTFDLRDCRANPAPLAGDQAGFALA